VKRDFNESTQSRFCEVLQEMQKGAGALEEILETAAEKQLWFGRFGEIVTGL